MSHHNDICKKCYENINNCDCDNFCEGNRRIYKPLRRINAKRNGEVEKFIRNIKPKNDKGNGKEIPG